MIAPENTDLPFHERLRVAVEKAFPGQGPSAQAKALRGALLDAGAHPHHASQLTIQRWLTGRGRPPVEVKGIFADFLGVSYRWLAEGDGVLLAGRRPAPAPATQEPVERAKRVRQKYVTEESAGTMPPEPPLPVHSVEVEVSIPLAADVHATTTRTISDFLKATHSAEAVRAILTHEPSNPTFEGGRKSVLKEAERKLKALEAAG